MRKLYLLVFLFGALISCGGEEPVTPGPNGGGTSTSSKITLTPFTQLNQGETQINSHADEWAHSRVAMDMRSYIDIGPASNVVDGIYPRVRTLKDGSYILTWQNSVGDANGNGKSTFYALSKDLSTWTYMGYLWQEKDVTNALGSPDKRYYTNANTIQLSNGKLLAVSNFRTAKTYNNINCKSDHGVVIKFSDDSGQTWYGEKEIYHGPCWEVHFIELPSGEVQAFFSESRPWTSSSHSGTVMVLSKDGGATWEPALGKEPYRVMRKHWWNEPKNMYCYTYQMPVGVILNNSKQFAFAMESCNQRVNGRDQFSIAIVRSKEDGKWVYLSGDEITPKSQRIDSVVTRGVAPYLLQFPSGEIIVSYGSSSNNQFFRMGNATATEFSSLDLAGLPQIGSWGGLDLTASHSILSTLRNNPAIALARFNLNHTISATVRTCKIDGDNSEWLGTDEALFVGSKSQAQATLRCAQDSDNIYFLIEALDDNLSTTDFAYIMFTPDGETRLTSKAHRIKIGCKGLKSTDMAMSGGAWKQKDLGVQVKTAFEGTLGNNNDSDKGWFAEFSVPRSSVEIVNGRVLVNFAYFDTAANVEDPLAPDQAVQQWIPIKSL